jgi:hypothetical protein
MPDKCPRSSRGVRAPLAAVNADRGMSILASRATAIGEVCAGVSKPALCSPPVPSLDGFERALARGERELPLLKALKGAIIAAKPLESDVYRLMRTSHSDAGRPNGQAGSDGDTRLARGYVIYDGWCNRARRGADSTVVVAPTGAASGSGPRQDAAGTLLLSVHDRSWLSSCRAKSAGSVSRSESRTTEQLNSKI